MKPAQLRNHKTFQRDPEGYYQLRVWKKAATRKMSERLRVKCGCCDKTLDIYHGGDSMEMGGVHASMGEWRRLLLPLLHPAPQNAPLPRNPRSAGRRQAPAEGIR